MNAVEENCIDILLYILISFDEQIMPIGLFLNILSIVGICFVFDLKKNFNRYLLAKDIANALFCLFSLLSYFYEYTWISRYGTWSECIILSTSKYIIIWVMSTLAPIFEVAASFDRYRFISSHFAFMEKCPFWAKSIAIILSVLGYNSYLFLEINCEAQDYTYNQTNQTVQYYSFVFSQFSSSRTADILSNIDNITRDIVFSLILIVINAATLWLMWKALLRKRRLTNNLNNRPNRNVLVAERAQTRTTQMMIVQASLIILCHVPYAAYYIILDLFPDIYFISVYTAICIGGVVFFLFYASYFLSFFVYFVFLKTFRHFYINLFVKAIRLVTCGRLFQPSSLNSST
jgi:hypothetical protein